MSASRYVPHILTFLSKTKLEQNAYELNFSKPDVKWLAGQHFMFFLPHFPFDSRGLFRVFTISSPPTSDVLTITTRFFDDKSSSFKRNLLSLKEGSKVMAIGPSPIYDYFRALDVESEYVFLVGGIGITPLHATLAYHLETGGKLNGTLLYANHDNELIYKEDIERATTQLEGFNTEYFSSDVSRITPDVIKKTKERYTDPKFIISGSRGFVDGMASMLINDLAVDRRKIIADKFRPILFAGGGY